MAIADPAPRNHVEAKEETGGYHPDTVDELPIDYACNRLQMTPLIHNVAMSLKERQLR